LGQTFRVLSLDQLKINDKDIGGIVSQFREVDWMEVLNFSACDEYRQKDTHWFRQFKGNLHGKITILL